MPAIAYTFHSMCNMHFASSSVPLCGGLNRGPFPSEKLAWRQPGEKQPSMESQMPFVARVRILKAMFRLHEESWVRTLGTKCNTHW